MRPKVSSGKRRPSGLGLNVLIPEEPPKPEEEADPKHARLKTIRTNPNQVILKSVETGDTFSFPSIYKASRFIDQSPRIITDYDGRIWNDKFEIMVDVIC